MSNELIEIPEENKARLAVFTGKSDIVEVEFGKITAHAKTLPTDMTNNDARDEVRSFAYRIARAKSAVDKVGKELTDHYKEIPRTIDAHRKQFRDSFEALQEEVRKPLTEYEEAEKEKQAKLQAELAHIKQLGTVTIEVPSERLNEIIAELKTFNTEPHGEMKPIADALVNDSLQSAQRTLESRLKQEAEAVELEQLRAEAAKRAEQDRIDEAKRAAEQAAKLAEERAKAAEQARVEAQKQAELDRAEAAKQAEIDKAQAVESARLAEAARQEAQAAHEAAARAAEEKERQQKAANLEHRRDINRAIVAALINHTGITEEQAQNVTKAAATGEIPNLKVEY